MSANIYDWSQTAANNSNADGDLTWAEGQAPSTVNNSARVMMKRVKDLLVDIGGSIAAGGTANGLTVTAANAFTAYADGQIIAFRATASNSAAATLNVNGIGAKAIRKMDPAGDIALIANDITNTGVYVAQYSAALNGAAGAWLLLNPTLLGFAGPTSATDNAVARFDGTTGRLLQNSTATIDDAGNATIISIDASATAGPTLTVLRASPSPLAADAGSIFNLDFLNSLAAQKTGFRIAVTMDDVTSGTEDATVVISNIVAGTITPRITLTAAGATIAGVITFTG